MATFYAYADGESASGTEFEDEGFALGADQTLNGLGGDDVLHAGVRTVLNGGDGLNRLIGDQDDTFRGGRGHDYVQLNLQGTDVGLDVDLGEVESHHIASIGDAVLVDVDTVSVLALGAGNDTVTAGTSYGRVIYGFDGDDHLTGGGAGCTLAGGLGRDTIQGGSGWDLLYGYAPEAFDPETGIAVGAPDDGLKRNLINGWDGNDTVVASAASDFMEGGAGINRVTYEASSAGVVLRVDGKVHDTGGSGWDKIRNFQYVEGSAFDDVIRGDGHVQHLFGGDGDDVLIGGGGLDGLHGGAGADVFFYGASAPMGDFIHDLDDGDIVDLHAIDANELKDGNQAFKLVSSFSGEAGELRAFLKDGDTWLSANVDGERHSDGVLFISGDHLADLSFIVL